MLSFQALTNGVFLILAESEFLGSLQEVGVRTELSLMIYMLDP